jgi:phosphoglycerate dehydrogenase-like enzyme
MNNIEVLVISPPDHYALRRLEPLREIAALTISNGQAQLEQLAPRAEVILFCGLSGAAVDFPAVFRRAAAVRWIHSLSAGVEKLLFPELVASRVPVTNARGVFKRSLAEFAVLGILYHTKKVRRLIENQRARRWDDFTVGFANELVMGVVGYGEIGRECALLAKAMGLKVHAVRRNPEKSAADPLVDVLFTPEQLHSMLAGVDVLLCSAPLTPETHHMIGAAELGLMKSTAIVINVGRGPVIDEAAMVAALAAGRIAGAALVVFEHEPLPPDSPLWGMDQVLISPHCTDRTTNPDWLELSMQFFVENFHRYRRGESLHNVVDKSAGY